MRAGPLSSQDVSDLVEEGFTCAWEKKGAVTSFRVREEPEVTLKVGGNILSYVCTADGRVILAIPGVLSAEQYLNELGRARDLARGLEGLSEAEAAARLRTEHREWFPERMNSWWFTDRVRELLSKHAYSRVGEVEKLFFERLLQEPYAPDKEIVIREVSGADFRALLESMPRG